MPIQINELVIRAIVESPPPSEKKASSDEEMDKESIIAECIEQVLEILQEKRER